MKKFILVLLLLTAALYANEVYLCRIVQVEDKLLDIKKPVKEGKAIFFEKDGKDLIARANGKDVKLVYGVKSSSPDRTTSHIYSSDRYEVIVHDDFKGDVSIYETDLISNINVKLKCAQIK